MTYLFAIPQRLPQIYGYLAAVIAATALWHCLNAGFERANAQTNRPEDHEYLTQAMVVATLHSPGGPADHTVKLTCGAARVRDRTCEAKDKPARSNMAKPRGHGLCES